LGKIILILLFLFGAALYFPQTRPAIVNTLEPILRPVVNPALRWQTRNEMNRIARELGGMHRRGEDLPAPGDGFQYWVGRTFQGGSSQDGWGNSYILRAWPDSLGIVSKGPDQELDTSDDLFISQSLERPGRNRR